MSAGALPGFRDFYPETFAQRSWLFERWRSGARAFGFSEYDGPPLEPLELYTKKSGDEIVGQLYSFTDKGGRDVALRPEMTPTVARMVAARANALRKPVRWFSIPQLFRYERQQKGRLREHFQLNVDIFGEADVAADAELLAVACGMMQRCGLGPDDVCARVSDRRLLSALLAALGVSDAATPAVFGAVDKIERDDRVSLIKRMTEAGVDASVAERILDIVKASDLPGLRRDFAGNNNVELALTRLSEYYELLKAHGVAAYFKLDLTIVRGLAYYTGIVFELFDTRGEFRAICGGGRYDTLLQALGGVDMPALGFGMGDVVLGEVVRAKALRGGAQSGSVAAPWEIAPPAPDMWLGTLEADAPAEAVRDAAILRLADVRVEMPLRSMSLSKQKKAARHATAKFFLEPRREDGLLRYVVIGLQEGARGIAGALDLPPDLAAVMQGRAASAEDIVAEVIRDWSLLRAGREPMPPEVP